MDEAGILNRRLNIAHSIWIGREEMDRMAEADAGAVLNHLSNLKLKSGIAPILDMREAGDAGRAGLRQLFGLGCPEHVPGDEDVLPSRRGQ